jgi:hypothetical protein
MACSEVAIIEKRCASAQPKLQTARHHQRRCQNPHAERHSTGGDGKFVSAKR